MDAFNARLLLQRVLTAEYCHRSPSQQGKNQTWRPMPRSRSTHRGGLPPAAAPASCAWMDGHRSRRRADPLPRARACLSSRVALPRQVCTRRWGGRRMCCSRNGSRLSRLSTPTWFNSHCLKCMWQQWNCMRAHLPCNKQTNTVDHRVVDRLQYIYPINYIESPLCYFVEQREN